ncbi:MAG TPA: cyclic nucleotide-binding domain-containing protein [Polyangiaceae bacterium]|jgi:serine/threonine protein phosphatase PrpC|nr:cyclic nucleotide-binding domain-containing protein [Polyangiaceae bacterium]
MESASISFAALSDVGKKRDHNEDSFLVDESLSLFVVCDGMGGHAAGEVASAIAVKTMQDEIRSESDVLRDYVAGKQGASKVSKKEILNMLEFAANRASQRVYQAAQADASKRGMGTTLVAILFVGPQAFVVHVGDSRLYQLRAGNLEQLTVDHNVYNELIKRKKMTREQVMQIAPKNAITRAVGVYESCEPESFAIDVVAGDRFLLCTDGLSEYFEEPQGSLQELGKAISDGDLDRSAKSLIDTANQRGGKDNITAVIVSLAGGEEASSVQDRLQEIEHKKQVLGQMPLFRQLDDVELRRVLQVTETQRYEEGQAIITEGQRGESLYIVLSGTVRVLRGEAVVKTLTVGEHFGEMALIRNQPRSASVISTGNSEMLVMHRAEFFEILRTQPRIAVKLLWQFTGVLADRLAETTRDLGNALAEELEPEDITEELFMVDTSEEDDDRLTNKLPPPPIEDGPVSRE